MTAEFEALVRAHQGAVCATAYAVLRDRGRSEEIAQDAFLIAWRKLPDMESKPVMPAFVCGIARNLARNAARKRREVEMPEREPIAGTASALDEVITREQIVVAEAALAALAEGDREIVVMYYRGEESVAEVASVLGISEGTARQRLHRSRERLRSAVASVEAALRATRPRAAFTVACVAALARGVVPADAEAATPVPSAAVASGTSLLPILFAVLIVGGGVAVGVRTATRGRDATTVNEPSKVTATGSTAPVDGKRGGILGRITAADRAALIERMRRARVAAIASATEPQEKIYDFADAKLDDIEVPDPPPTGPLAKRTLRYAIKLVQPLLLECQPHGSGRLAIRMRLIGDPENPTVVESVDVVGEPPLSDDAALVACVRETLFRLELPPMPGPGIEQWDVNYPFVVDTR